MSARRVGYLSSRRKPQPVLPQATVKIVSCDASSCCDVMRTVNIPQRGHANTFGRDLLTTRNAFLLLRPIFSGRTLQVPDKTFTVGMRHFGFPSWYRIHILNRHCIGKPLSKNYRFLYINMSVLYIRDKRYAIDVTEVSEALNTEMYYDARRGGPVPKKAGKIVRPD